MHDVELLVLLECEDVSFVEIIWTRIAGFPRPTHYAC